MDQLQKNTTTKPPTQQQQKTRQDGKSKRTRQKNKTGDADSEDSDRKILKWNRSLGH